MNELYHHGILGQRWGKRNGPPYPLDAEDHSASEKKAGWRKSVTQKDLERYNDRKKAEKEKNLKGKPLKDRPISKEDIDGYREEMLFLNKHDPEKSKFYKNATDKEIADDIRRKQEIRRNIAIAAGVIGAGAAVYFVYKKSLNDRIISDVVSDLKSKGVDPTEEAIQNAIKGISPLDMEKYIANAADDMNYVLSKGTVLKRMDGFSDFDIDKITKPLFVSDNDVDASIYELLLGDFNHTGKRYKVDLEAINDIVAPNREKTYEIITQKLRQNPEYVNNLAKMLKVPNYVLSQRMLDDDTFFKAAIFALKDGGKATDIFKDTFFKEGFNAVLDFHDIDDKLTNTPLILLNTQADVIKAGENFVTGADRMNAVNYLMQHVNDIPDSATYDTIQWLYNTQTVSTINETLGMKNS